MGTSSMGRPAMLWLRVNSVEGMVRGSLYPRSVWESKWCESGVQCVGRSVVGSLGRRGERDLRLESGGSL